MTADKPIPCEHWQDCGVASGGCCAIEEYDRPSFGTCGVCLTIQGKKPEGWFGPKEAQMAVEALAALEVPTWFLNRDRICTQCDNARCMMKHMGICQRRALLKRPAQCCPIHKWLPEKV